MSRMRSRLTARDGSRVKSNETFLYIDAEKGREKECFPADAEKTEARSRERKENKRVGSFRFVNEGGKTTVWFWGTALRQRSRRVEAVRVSARA